MLSVKRNFRDRISVAESRSDALQAGPIGISWVDEALVIRY